jgi:hypothetical protein
MHRATLTHTRVMDGHQVVLHVTPRDLQAMTERQLDDLRTGLALVAAACMPDAAFERPTEVECHRVDRVERVRTMADRVPAL